MKTLFLALAVFIVALFFVASVDDDLSDDANALIQQIDENAKSESYLFLSGIFAAEDENPSDVGAEILKELRSLEPGELFTDSDYKKLPLPLDDVFCKASDDGCLASLFLAADEVEKLLITHKTLISRANQFFDFDEYKTLTKPTASEPLPPYKYILTAERLKVLSAILTYKNGDPEKAIESLLLQFLKLRKSLALQDNLIGNIVFLTQLSEILDVTSIILSESGVRGVTLQGSVKPKKAFRGLQLESL